MQTSLLTNDLVNKQKIHRITYNQYKYVYIENNKLWFYSASVFLFHYFREYNFFFINNNNNENIPTEKEKNLQNYRKEFHFIK